MSSWVEVLSGIPRGSILGFLLINDLVKFYGEDANIFLFADDAKLFNHIRTQDDEVMMQNCIDNFALAIIVYCAETWSMTEANRKRLGLGAFHHSCLRKVLNITWKDKVRNGTIRDSTGQDMLEECEDTEKKRRLRWFGHVQRMEDSRKAKQALHWIPVDHAPPGETVSRDIKYMEMTWEDVCHKAMDREEWKEWTARCASHRMD